MTRKSWLLVAAAILLGTLSIYFNQDWFAKDHIQIFDRSRPARGPLASQRRAGNPAINRRPENKSAGIHELGGGEERSGTDFFQMR